MKKKYFFIGLLILIVAIGVISYYNRFYIKPWYKDLTTNKFKSGDNIYCPDILISKDISIKVPLYRATKIVKSRDYDYILSGYSISSDSMFKYHTKSVGTYITTKFEFVPIGDTIGNVKYYTIKPDQRVVIKSNSPKLPQGNVYVDNHPI